MSTGGKNMNTIFERTEFKGEAKKQIMNVIVIFLIFTGASLVLMYASGQGPWQTLYSLNEESSYPLYRYSYYYNLLGAGAIAGLCSLALHCAEPYFEIKACVLSQEKKRKIEISEVFKSCSWNEFIHFFGKQMAADLIIMAVLVAGILLILVALSAGVMYSYSYNSLLYRQHYYTSAGLPWWSIIFFLLSIVCFVIVFILKYRYALVKFLAMEEPELKVMETLKVSAGAMKGYKYSAFVMDLSFLGWFFLTALTGGILSIYVTPYYMLAQMQMYYRLIGVYVLDDAQLKQEIQSETVQREPVNEETAENTDAEKDTREDAQEEKPINFCPYCGEKMDDPYAKFCPHCGSRLRK
jgi:uncharacterized membrane protein/DNA-directed RNA polymerase subunit RPC12/RpoP